MHYRRFVFFNLIGGVFWAIGMTLIGYFLGLAFGTVEGVDRYFTLLILAFFFIPGIPTLIHVWKDNRHSIINLVRTKVLGKEPLPKPTSTPTPTPSQD